MATGTYHNVKTGETFTDARGQSEPGLSTIRIERRLTCQKKYLL